MNYFLFSLALLLAGCRNPDFNQDSGWAGRWGNTFEGQRRADLGNGYYRNPILAGDYPDPSVLKDGDDYYMVHSSFDYLPGLLIWHSRDLINWQPLTCALYKNVGSVWAPDLAKYKGKYYIYFPARRSDYKSNYVITADNIKGPWSDPIDLHTDHIDPGHAVGVDGERYLFLSGGYVVPLSADGLKVTGAARQIHTGWKYPEEWIVESFSLEGPKILFKDGYYYLVQAEGGTAGPPTSHMVIAARSKNILGPYENSPYNPIVRTWSRSEYWWSKGHATLVEGTDAKWYLTYHGYENDYYNLGRQTLLEPVEWTTEGWFRTIDGLEMSKPMSKPIKSGPGIEHGQPFSDDFGTDKMGRQWRFYKEFDTSRFQFKEGNLIIKGKGTSPKDCSPLAFICGDLAYQIEIELELAGNASAGLLLYYSEDAYAGLGFSKKQIILHRYGTERYYGNDVVSRVFIRLTNIDLICTMYYSYDGIRWKKMDTQIDVSGYHHNVHQNFLSLRPALYAAGDGKVIFKDFSYRSLVD